MKKIISISMNSATFVTTTSNRQVKVERLVKNIKVNKGVDVPPIVFRANDFLDETIFFKDLMTGTPIEQSKLQDACYLIADGQHRIAAALKINQEAKKKMEVSNNQLPDLFNLPIVDMVLCDKEELHGRNINEYIANINGTASNWKHKDFIKMAYVEKESDKNMQVINLMQESGMSISTISRYLAFNNKKMNDKMLIDYANGDNSAFIDLRFKRGMRILLLLCIKGFNMKFLKKRYMIDYIIDKHQGGDLELCLKKIASLKEDDIIDIESLSPDNLNPENLGRIIDERTSCVDNNSEGTSGFEMPKEEDLNNNLKALKQYIDCENKKKQKAPKKIKYVYDKGRKIMDSSEAENATLTKII